MDVTAPTRPGAAQEPYDPSDTEDAEYVRMLQAGALFGTPLLYLVVLGVCLLAAPGNPALVIAALWPAAFAGWYFGAMVALTRFELRHEHAGQPRPERRRVRARKRIAPTGMPVPTR